MKCEAKLDGSQTTTLSKEKEERTFKFKAAAFLTGVTGVSVLFGFGTTLAAAKKSDPHFFDQGVTGRFEHVGDTQATTTTTTTTTTSSMVGKHKRSIVTPMESGASLAARALGWGTLYSVAGCSVLFYGIWKLMGVNDLREFRSRIGDWLPSIPRNNPPQGRTEFSGLNDLLQYIIDVDEENKDKKTRNQ